MLIKAFYKLEGADRVVQKMKFRVIKKSELTKLQTGEPVTDHPMAER